MSRNSVIYKRAKEIIPGGTQLLSKRPELFSAYWPSHYKRAKGVIITDLDDNQFVDMSIMGVGAAILGYADPEVDQAVIENIKNGVQTSLLSPLEVDLGELLLKYHPWFDAVRYAKSGGEAMAMAVRIARAATGREKVFFSGYHGWHDWYLAANLASEQALDGQLMPGLEPIGVPRSLAGTAYPVDLANIECSIADTQTEPDTIAAIVIEPARGSAVSKQALINLRKYCDRHNIVLIYDEITSGFRCCTGAMHRLDDVKPDIAVLAKAMANGYSAAAILGIKAVMDATQRTFISSTNWTESTGFAASIATIKKYEATDAASHVNQIGSKFKEIWRTAFQKHSINCEVTGIDSLPAFQFNGEHQLAFYNFFVSEMLKYKVLAFRQFKPSLAHNDAHLDQFTEALDKVLVKYNNIDRDLSHYEDVQVGFHRLMKE